jgi:type I restriction enzyme S subunit
MNQTPTADPGTGLASSITTYAADVFRSICQDWRLAILGDLFAIQQGKALNTKTRTGRSLRPFLRTSNLLWGNLDLSVVDEMDFTPEEERRFALRAGDLLTCEGGDVGRTAIWAAQIHPCFYQNHIHRLRTKRHDVHPEFFMRWMEYAVRRMNLYGGSSNKTTIPNLSKSRLASFLVPQPPVAEQRAIAAVLRTVQQAKDACEHVIAATRQLKQSLLHHLFTYGPIPFDQVNKVLLQETKIGPFPEHWQLKRLGDLIERPEYGLTATTTGKPAGPRFLRITDIQDGKVTWSTVPYCECSEQEGLRKALRSDDILVARIGATTGKTILVTQPPRGVFASYLIRLRTKHGLLPGFLLAFTRTSVYWRQIDAAKGGRLKQGVNIPVLKTLLLPHPPLSEQSAIAAQLATLDAKLEAEEQRYAALDNLFESLLHHLMTGQLRVNHLVDQLGAQSREPDDHTEVDQPPEILA